MRGWVVGGVALIRFLGGLGPAVLYEAVKICLLFFSSFSGYAFLCDLFSLWYPIWAPSFDDFLCFCASFFRA